MVPVLYGIYCFFNGQSIVTVRISNFHQLFGIVVKQELFSDADIC